MTSPSQGFCSPCACWLLDLVGTTRCYNSAGLVGFTLLDCHPPGPISVLPFALLVGTSLWLVQPAAWNWRNKLKWQACKNCIAIHTAKNWIALLPKPTPSTPNMTSTSIARGTGSSKSISISPYPWTRSPASWRYWGCQHLDYKGIYWVNLIPNVNKTEQEHANEAPKQ